MDMSKYRDLFLSETREHLSRMSQLLVDLEKEGNQCELVDELFREAHSVKGMAASMGFGNMAELGHHLEDYLDQFRQDGSVPGAAVDRLLAGCDLLEGLLSDIAEERPERDIQVFLNQKELPSPCGSSSPEPVAMGSEESVLLPEEEPGTDENQDDEKQALAVLVVLAPEAPAPAARALLALGELEGLGRISALQPSRELMSAGQPLNEFSLHLHTGVASEKVESLLSRMADIVRVSVVPVSADPLPQRRREDRERTVRVRTDLLDGLINLAGELITNRFRIQEATSGARRDLPEALDELHRLVDNVHRDVLKVRLMPLESIVGRIPRLVRDHCRTSGKQVQLDIQGAEIELDRAVLEELGDPLIHLVRNAIDHGIADRGDLRIKAWRERDLVLLEVADNGRGIDPKKVRRRAEEKGILVKAAASELNDREVLQLICQPGFSTAEKVTELSGRGVGMDAVKTAVEKIGGQLDLQSRLGSGTRFLLRLPLSAAIMRVLLVGCQPQVLALPISRVVQALEVERDQIQVSGRQRVIRYQDELVPLLSLRKLLALDNRGNPGQVPVVVCDLRGRRVGLVVDEFIAQQEVFVRTLEQPLANLAGVNGATVLGNGRLVFVLDPTALLDAHEMGERQLRVVNH